MEFIWECILLFVFVWPLASGQWVPFNFKFNLYYRPNGSKHIAYNSSCQHSVCQFQIQGLRLPELYARITKSLLKVHDNMIEWG